MQATYWSRIGGYSLSLGIRPFTFFEKGVVGHVGFADPFDEKIAKVPTPAIKQIGDRLEAD